VSSAAGDLFVLHVAPNDNPTDWDFAQWTVAFKPTP
jgi:hypothetical protein